MKDLPPVEVMERWRQEGLSPEEIHKRARGFQGKREKLTARMAFALTPSLKQAFEARAEALHLDVPALARAALALVAEKGLDFGNDKK